VNGQFFIDGLTEENLEKKKIWVEIFQLCEEDLKSDGDSFWDVEEVNVKRRLLRR
jgi:hypothetical protein